MSGTPHKGTEFSISTESIVKLLFILLIAYGLFLIKNIILIILTSVVIASFVHAGVRRLKRFHIPRSVAVVIIYILGFTVFGVALWLFVPVFVDELIALIALLPDSSALGGVMSSFEQGGIRDVFGSLSANGTNPLEIVQQIRSQFSAGGLFRGTAAIFGGIVNFILVLVISFYLSMDAGSIDEFLRTVTPKKYEDYVSDVWGRTHRKIGSWFKGQLMLAAILAVLTYIGLSIIGVPYALMLALVAALLGLVPYGIILGIVPALLVGFLAGGVSMLIFVLILYAALQQFENYILQPILIKKVTGIPSLVVLLAVIIGVKLLGFLGLILAIPFSVVILEIVRDKHANKKAAKVV